MEFLCGQAAEMKSSFTLESSRKQKIGTHLVWNRSMARRFGGLSCTQAPWRRSRPSRNGEGLAVPCADDEASVSCSWNKLRHTQQLVFPLVLSGFSGVEVEEGEPA
eukprot:GHVS01066406.1.p1 GENE.GHVS01066406.1~~GHVS01066406.1.p1  ORF type:complete len:106 (+),score=11.31 GHVS01066406.1:264-581(+)